MRKAAKSWATWRAGRVAPNCGAVVDLAKCGGISPLLRKLDLGFKVFKFGEVSSDGDRGHLHDRPPGLQAGRFQIDEDKSLGDHRLPYEG